MEFINYDDENKENNSNYMNSCHIIEDKSISGDKKFHKYKNSMCFSEENC